MKLFQYTGAFILLMALISCGDQKSADTTEDASAEAKPCTFDYSTGSLAVKWTAFKTTEKVGVSGTFDTLNIAGTKAANTIVDVFSNASFSIPVSSVNSANPDRDKKIFEHFFGTMSETATLTGRVIGVEEEVMSVAITMNGVTDTTAFEVSASDSLVTLSGIISLADWNALESADALNKVCNDLHKGADGVSKLWPDVKLDISAAISKTCE
ncbi:MAG: YceI family protein [Flavobacteriales bacterium]|nr:YceI family protein [Flavobacteriales bacterium]